MSSEFSHLSDFKRSEKQIEDMLDPDINIWKEDPATQKQIRKVYVLIKKHGIEKEEAEARWDFHHMTKGEISELIDELEY